MTQDKSKIWKKKTRIIGLELHIINSRGNKEKISNISRYFISSNLPVHRHKASLPQYGGYWSGQTVLYVPEHGSAQVNVMLHQSHPGVSGPALLVVVAHYVLVVGIWVLCEISLYQVSRFLCSESTQKHVERCYQNVRTYMAWLQMMIRFSIIYGSMVKLTHWSTIASTSWLDQLLLSRVC